MLSDLYRRCASLFVVGFRGPQLDADVASLVDDGVGGVIFFKRNISSAQETASLVRELKVRARRPLLASVDQEGGRVARLRGAPFTALPSMRTIGLRGDVGVAERVGRLLAFELRALGFDQDYAPVLDVDTNPHNPVIGDRALHHEAPTVARLGIALAQGLEAGGVASCAKHFPGHGDTSQDSHLALPSLPHGLERLRRVELVPFAAYARAGLAAVMTAHVVFEALEPGVPATMSRLAMDGVLRNELGFDGVIVSDDLEMSAIAQHFTVEEAAVRGLGAGVDQFLVCHQVDVQRRAIEAVVRAVESGEVPEARLGAACARIEAMKDRFVRGPEDRLDCLGSAAHHSLAQGLELEPSSGADPTERNA